MYITNWNEDRKDKKYINQIFTSINKELSETKEDIITQIALHNILIDSLDFYERNNTITLMDIAIKVNGIQMPTIKLSSWKAISNSKIELLKYENISTLANIENLREVLIMKNANLSNFIYPNINETTRNKKQILKVMMMDIMSTETAIQKEIEKVLKN
ncbi:hypothetical protein [Zobellia uliginosa]|uniref:hypothetical protein n=1 Tax=Zobellia uliginosa TaxID=143224 RepID=UPI002091D752|nr:hypothetical protein [Zobellia uliginosa]